jgi:hypothetical protein
MRQVIADSDRNTIISLTSKVKGHLLDEVIVIGQYKKGSKFGGCDSIEKVKYMEDAIWKALEKMPTVLFEGLLVSHSFERWVKFSDNLCATQKKHKAKEHGMVWAFIIPTFKESVLRMRGRNNIKGSLREVKGEEFVRNFISRYKSIRRLQWKAVNETKPMQCVFQLPPTETYPFFKRNVLGLCSKDKTPCLIGVRKKGISKFV